ncbi:MAG: ABC transporter ATP-binding protein [Gammaproteobacteria bacterium]|nr:ABC transporter ATP-binding protein [Gammaproteobacteria bacterium]
MSLLEVRGVTHFYGQARALDEVSFDCEQGEFFTLFGPSGAGKTTLLELIAGIQTGYQGAIKIRGRDLAGAPIQERHVAMAFENYALYPHLSVRENIAFPLRSPRAADIGEAAIAKKVRWISDELGIGDLLDRNPAQLSGGQKQRVSLARALVRDADVYLLDEPIAHLDAKLRTVARANLKAMAGNLGATIVYVTHDYREALGLSDRVLVLDQGRVLQVADPRTIYHQPATDTVGRLVGDPAMNLLDGVLSAGAGNPVFTSAGIDFHLNGKLADEAGRRLAAGKPEARLGVRPSAVSAGTGADDPQATRLPVYALEGGAQGRLAFFEVGAAFLGGSVTRAADIPFKGELQVKIDGNRGHLFNASFPMHPPGPAETLKHR